MTPNPVFILFLIGLTAFGVGLWLDYNINLLGMGAF